MTVGEFTDDSQKTTRNRRHLRKSSKKNRSRRRIKIKNRDTVQSGRQTSTNDTPLNDTSERFSVITTDPDGSCLFRAVSYHIFGDQENHKKLRRTTIDYIVNKWDFYCGFIPWDKDQYVVRMLDTRSCADHVEISALSDMLALPIRIYNDQFHNIHSFNDKNIDDSSVINLYYVNGNHYNALVDKLFPFDSSKVKNDIIMAILSVEDKNDETQILAPSSSSLPVNDQQNVSSLEILECISSNSTIEKTTVPTNLSQSPPTS